MMVQIIIQTGILIVLYVGTIILRNYWSKYFETKGSNQATKEDIGNITGIVESIKSELLKETEELKAQMAFLNQHKLNLKAAEREAIFDYNKKLHAYIYYLVRFTLSGYDYENYKDLKKEEIEIAKRKYECDVAQGHLTLFMHDEEFIKANMEVALSALKYEQLLSKAMMKIYGIFALSEFKVAADPKNEYPIREEAYNSFLPLFNQFNKESLVIYQKIVSDNSKLTKLIHQRILATDQSA